MDPADLPWFLGLMEHLATRGIVCPLPVHGRDGAALRGAVRAARGDHHVPAGRLAAPGAPGALRAAGRGAGGAAPGRAGLRADAAQRAGPGRLAPAARARARPGATRCSPGLAAELDGGAARILAAWPGGLPVGHIHADLFPDNVFFLDGKLSGLIDFYFAATDLLAYDVAVCLNAWCFEPDFSFNVTKARALLAAYDGEATAVGGGARGAAGAVPGGRDPLPADPAVRLDQHAAGRAGDAQGPAASTCAGCASIWRRRDEHAYGI